MLPALIPGGKPKPELAALWGARNPLIWVEKLTLLGFLEDCGAEVDSENACAFA